MFDTGTITDMGRGLAGVDVRDLPDSTLTDATVALESLISFAQTAQAHVLAELDARGTTDRDHGMTTVSWVSAATGCARSTARSRLKVGRALRDHFDQVDDALGDGRIGFDHAKALADVANPRVAAVFEEAQQEIIDLAVASTFQSWKADLTALAEYADTDGAEPDPYAHNELHLARTLDGHTDVRGSFDTANGTIVNQAIEDKADELFRRFTHDHELSADLTVPSRKVLRALALVELLREALGSDPATSAAPRAEVTLVVHDHETTDPDGVPMPQAATDIWGCDPEVWAVVMNHMGIPVDVGHTKRLATIAQRRAIAIRDGGCTFPGCDAPINWCDLHHATDWHLGGPTDLENLVALCRHHHGVTHRTGWSMTLDDHQIPHWESPSGDDFHGQRHRRRQPEPHRGPGTKQDSASAEQAPGGACLQ